MTTLPIVKVDIIDYTDQVFCTKDFYHKSTLVLFIHDAPDVVLGTNATISSRMDLNDAFVASSINLFVLISARPVRSILRMGSQERLWISGRQHPASEAK